MPLFRYILTCLIFVLVGLHPADSYSQLRTVELKSVKSGELITDLLTVTKTEAGLPPDQVWPLIQQSEFSGNHYYGFVQNIVWAGFALKNPSEANNWVVEVLNPHLSYIDLYKRTDSGGDWKRIGSTGRSAAFTTRDIEHTNFAFEMDIPPGTEAEILIMLDKSRSSIHYPVKIWSAQDFYLSQQRNYAFFGLYFGFFAIVVFVSFIAFLITFNRQFFWYFIYVLSVGLFVFNDLGLAQKYIYPDSEVIGGHARMGITYVMMFALNYFAISYFRTKELYPVIHQFITGCCAVFSLIALVHLFFTDFAIQHATVVIITLYAAILCSIGAAVWVAFMYYRIEKYSSILFISAFSFIFASGILFILSEFGLIELPQMLFTPVQVASVFEILFLSVGIAWQIRISGKQRQTLNEKVGRLENEILRSYISGTEKERARVAMELHDGIGTRLSQLSRNAESGQQKKQSFKNEIKTILNSVRQISHKLSPSGIASFGLTATAKQLVREINKSSSVNYAFQGLDIPDDLPEDVSIQLYRIIQESIQNIEKHSSAKNAEIQLIAQEDQIVLTIEDDGVGAGNIEQSNKGIGLYNIKKRVAYLGGDLSLSSRPGEGVEIVVTVELK